MPVGISDFNKNNTVLLRAPIKRQTQAPFPGQPEFDTPFDFIDINGDGNLDLKPMRGISRNNSTVWIKELAEPVQELSSQQLSRFVEQENKPVLLEEDLGEHGVLQGTSSNDWPEIETEKGLSYSDLADQLAPMEPGARAGIDTSTGDFLVYVPKS